ncbi:hypothetical protein MYSTI_02464 [Myxococcus stipitatus DSM 14675]|uniref:Uncharacterized protein n=1 Tax=Myxococcus stipitatus (strain DSM 14675 / JCM 12634 / Mx s8) TaxID=1278073 RepID=L7U7G1_MYXSD|nr:hypothetical protein MYSTI_02464 [Myxococcus stipitatus DSM 14675]
MRTGVSALESTDWPRLIHAYGRGLDTPGHLRALLAEDAKGTVNPATAQVALVLAGFNDGFPEKPPPLPMQPRFTVAQRLLERVPDFDTLAEAAVAVARTTKKAWVDFEWGLLLTRAFPTGDGTVTSEAQRRFLAALVDTAHLWDPRFGNPGTHFWQAGLPYERDACAKLVGGTRGRPSSLLRKNRCSVHQSKCPRLREK